jgi:hypothetical protein
MQQEFSSLGFLLGRDQLPFKLKQALEKGAAPPSNSTPNGEESGGGAVVPYESPHMDTVRYYLTLPEIDPGNVASYAGTCGNSQAFVEACELIPEKDDLGPILIAAIQGKLDTSTLVLHFPRIKGTPGAVAQYLVDLGSPLAFAAILPYFTNDEERRDLTIYTLNLGRAEHLEAIKLFQPEFFPDCLQFIEAYQPNEVALAMRSTMNKLVEKKQKKAAKIDQKKVEGGEPEDGGEEGGGSILASSSSRTGAKIEPKKEKAKTKEIFGLMGGLFSTLKDLNGVGEEREGEGEEELDSVEKERRGKEKLMGVISGVLGTVEKFALDSSSDEEGGEEAGSISAPVLEKEPASLKLTYAEDGTFTGVEGYGSSFDSAGEEEFVWETPCMMKMEETSSPPS